MLPIKAVSFRAPKASLSPAARRSSQTDAKRRFRRTGRLAAAVLGAAVLGAAVLALVGASAASAALPLTAYVSNAKDDVVTPLNLETSKAEAGISTGGTLTSSIAITPSGLLAYAPALTGETLLPINLDTNVVEAGITLTEKKGETIEPEAVAITPNGSLAWVIDEEINKTAEGAISVVEVATNKVVTRIKNVGEEPEGVAFTPDGSLAWVVDKATEKQGLVTVINTGPKTIAKQIKIGTASGCLAEGTNPAGACVEPEKIAITPNGKTAYVANGAAGTVSVIQITGTKVAETIEKVGLAEVSSQEPDNIAITPNGSLAYATDGGDGLVVAINIKTSEIEARIPVGPAGTTLSGTTLPHGLAITPNGLLVVVTNEEEEKVKTIDTATNQIAGLFLVFGEPDGVAIRP